MARFVSEIGTGPIGSENGAKIQVTAVITPMTASCRVENPGLLGVLFVVTEALDIINIPFLL